MRSAITMADDSMWSLVMFDLPVLTLAQRRAANRFRNLLLDRGYAMLQFSVYVRYLPTGGGQDHSTIEALRHNLPPGGDVRMLYVSDRQWSNTLRFHNATEEKPEPAPVQLTIF